MARESNYQGFAASGDNLYIPFYGVQSASMNIQRVDLADSIGDVQATNLIAKQYTYPDVVYKFDVPLAMYDFTAANPHGAINMVALNRSTAAAPAESISGRVLTLAGGNLVVGNYGFSRFAGKYFMVPTTVQVTDAISGGIVTSQENAGFGWSVSGWFFRAATSAASWYYLEHNNAITSYIGLLNNTNGTISLNIMGTSVYTTPVGAPVPSGSWNFVVITYDGANMRYYLNNALSGGPTARTHSSGITTTNQRLNHGASGIHYTQSVAVYSSVLTQAQINRQYLEITNTDYYSGGIYSQGGTMGQGATINLIFTNDLPPQQVQNSGGLSLAVLPLAGIGQIRFRGPAAASYVFELKVIENEAIT